MEIGDCIVSIPALRGAEFAGILLYARLVGDLAQLG